MYGIHSFWSVKLRTVHLLKKKKKKQNKTKTQTKKIALLLFDLILSFWSVKNKKMFRSSTQSKANKNKTKKIALLIVWFNLQRSEPYYTEI